MQFSCHINLHIRSWLLPCACCWLLQNLCLTRAVESSAGIPSSPHDPHDPTQRCDKILGAGASAAGACSRGNSLLQLASKPSRSHTVTTQTDQEDTSDHSPATKASTKANVEALEVAAQPAVIVAAASAGPIVATARTTLVQVALAMRQYLYMAHLNQSRGLISITIFGLICLLGMFILCFILHVQSENRRAEQLVQGRSRNAQGFHHSPTFGSSSQNPSRFGTKQEARTGHHPPSPSPGRALPANTLCPGLVVPPNSDCVLVIRMLPRMQAAESDWDAAAGRGATPPLELDIFDLLGKPVLSASIAQPLPKQGHVAVTLHTLSGAREAGSRPLTTCRAGSTGNSVYIYDKDEVLFGSVRKDTAQQNSLPNFHRYVLNRNTGDALLLFEGSFEEHRLNVFNPPRAMIAHAEPCKQMPFEPDGRFYQVRIAAGQDVGLVLASLLSIDAMEARCGVEDSKLPG